MAKLAPGQSFSLGMGSCVDQKVAERRLQSMATYLQAVLEEPRLRSNVDVRAFLEQGQVRAAETMTDVRPAATNTYVEDTVGGAEGQDRLETGLMADGASAVGVVNALSPPAALAGSPIHLLVCPQTPPSWPA